MNNLDRWAQYNFFWDNVAPQLSSVARDVWLSVFRHANVNGASFITRGRIAGMLSVSTAHVDNGIRELKTLNMIVKISNNNGYVLSLPSMDEALPDNQGYHPTQPELSPPLTTIVITPDNQGYHHTQPELSPLITRVITLQNPLTEPYTEPITELPHTPKTPKQKAGATESEQFKLFYAAYPKKRNRPAALKAWNTKKINESIDIILASLERWKASHDWTKDNGKFIPYPASWLNAEGWNDDIEPEKNEEQRKFEADLAGLGF